VIKQKLRDVYVVEAVRTPIGKFRGALSSIRSDDLATLVIKELMARSNLPSNTIEGVIWGATNQAGEDSRNVARQVALMSGLNIETHGTTINTLCSSSLVATIYGAQAIMLGEGEAYITGGSESMSRAPWVMLDPDLNSPRGKSEIIKTAIGWRFTNPNFIQKYMALEMPETGEVVAKKYNVSREIQDTFALNSQIKYKKAFENGLFKKEIVPVKISRNKNESFTFDNDECPRSDTTLEKLANLKTVYKEGTITAGNSSCISDGAAALLLTSEEIIKEYNLKPIGKIESWGRAGVHPDYMGIGPIVATKKALGVEGIGIERVGLVELNEAFAAQCIPCIEQLELNPEIVNVNGGAIALGHPLGASGSIILTKLLHELSRRNDVEYALATMCVGIGQGDAILFRNPDYKR